MTPPRSTGDYRHDEKRRKNNPPVGMVAYEWTLRPIQGIIPPSPVRFLPPAGQGQPQQREYPAQGRDHEQRDVARHPHQSPECAMRARPGRV